MAKKRKAPPRNVNKPKINAQKAANLANEAIEFCKSGDYVRGIRLFRKAEERAGKNDQIYINLAIAYHAINDFDNAKKYYKKAMSVKPAHVMRVLQNGINELSMNKLESAESCISAVFELDPNNITAKLATGSLMLRRKEKAEGAEILRECYRSDPAMSSAIMELTEFGEITPADVEKALKNLADGLGQRDNDKYLYLAIGKAYDQFGEYKSAFESFSKANELFAKGAHISCYQAANDLHGHYENVLNTLTPEFISQFSGMSDAGENMIFVVGLPKSGLHEAALLLQESKTSVIVPEMNWCNQKIFQMLQASDNDFKASVEKMTRDTVETLVADYKKIVAGLVKTGKLIINCKAANFVNVWFIKILFPKARIVCASRNIDDQAFAIYFTNVPGMEYLNDLISIGTYCKAQSDLMAYWDKIYGKDLVHFDYDAYIADPDKAYEKLMSDLGIEKYERYEYCISTKPTLNIHEVYRPEKSFAENYAEFAGSLSSVLHPAENKLALNFGNFDTAGAETGTGDFKLNFGTAESEKKKEDDSDNGGGFKLKF